jgi:hypothetical protein
MRLEMSRLPDACLSWRHLVAGIVGAVALPVASSALLPISPADARAVEQSATQHSATSASREKEDDAHMAKVLTAFADSVSISAARWRKRKVHGGS